MKNKSKNRLLQIGLAAWGLGIVSGIFFDLPEIISGFLMGLSIVSLILFAISKHYDIGKVRMLKRTLLKKSVQQ